MKRRLATAAATAAVLLVLTACTPDRIEVTPTADAAPPSGTSSPSADLTALYAQDVVWEACGDLECATLRAPIDWTNPTGETFGLAINRHRATGEVYGSLLINPGGPGGSGLDLTGYFATFAGDPILEHYDIVGFDPRGVGESAGIECGDAATIDAYIVDDHSFETEQDINAARERNTTFAEGCRDLSGPLLENIDTVSAARDMDLMRAVLGDEQLTYLGYSYGTQLGATYAALYPENVGRMVLDGAVDFLLPEEEIAAGQAAGFESALTAYVEWCHDQNGCPLDSGTEAAKKQIHDLAVGAIDRPLDGGDGVQVNGNLMTYGIVVTLYDEGSWPYLSQALSEVIDQGTATIMRQLADFYLDRDSSTGEYTANSTIAFTAINCLDSPEEEPWDVARLDEWRTTLEEASPTFGWWFAAGVGCDGWPYAAHERVTSLDSTADTAPIVVIGTTNDPATPYQWAESLTAQLGNATLLTYVGEGHTAYGRSNACVLDAVDAYFLEGTMPAEGTRC